MKIVVMSNNCLVNTPCCICGDGFEADMVMGWAFEDDADTTDRRQSIGYVCPDCLAAGVEGMKQRVTAWSERMAEAAAEARRYADEIQAGEIDAATTEEYELELDRMHCLRLGCTREQLEAHSAQVEEPF